jgi:cell wall-associated NlpC family hydrolase
VEAFLACARQALGGVYCTPAREPNCTDCSGLVRRCYRQATGQDITGDSHEQIKLGTPVSRSDVQPGDLLFWDTAGGTEVRGGNAASHVGIAAGGNRMFNALDVHLGIRDSDLSSGYWTQEVTFLEARRLEF